MRLILQVFDFQSYKDYIKNYIKNLPKKGRGTLRKMALYLEIHPVAITQVFNGDRDLTLEQAAGLTKFLSLSPIEAEYFISMVEHSRAGNDTLRAIVKSRLEKIKEETQKLENRIPKNVELSEEAKATFYSAWYFSAARLASGIENNFNAEDVARSIGIDRAKASQAVDFLLQHGLCALKNGKLIQGPQFTHLSAESPLVVKHHTNWRLKSLQSMEKVKLDSEMYITLPTALSVDLAKEIREKLLKLIGEIMKEIKESKSETLYCLNLDWFKFQK